MAPFQGCALDCTWKQRVAAEVFNLWEESRRGKSSLQLTDDFVDLCIAWLSATETQTNTCIGLCIVTLYTHSGELCGPTHSPPASVRT